MSNLSDLIQSNSGNYSTTEADGRYKKNPYLFKNLLINGDFNIWQRGEKTDLGNGYAADRWRSWVSEDLHSVSKIKIILPNGTNNNGIRLTGRKIYSLTQVFEDYFPLLHDSSVTLSFWGRCSSNYTVNIGTFRDKTLAENVGTSAPCELTPMWQKFEHTWNFGDMTSRFDHLLTFYLVAGLNQGESVLDFDICQAQLEIGNRATSFEIRPPEIELSLCQRYYEKSYNIDIVPGTLTTSGGSMIRLPKNVGSGDQTKLVKCNFKSVKALPPTVNIYSTGTGAIDKIFNDSLDIDKSCNVYGLNEKSFVANHHDGVSSVDQEILRFQWTADAEI